MYKVFFEDLEIFTSSSLEDALALALSMHRASNISHKIYVYDPDKDQASIVLERS